MPNWMKVKIEVVNKAKFDFTRDFKSFNDILPMPTSIKNTSSGYVSEFVDTNKDKGLQWLLENRGNIPLLKVARSYRSWQLYGYVDWYKWSYRHWGSSGIWMSRLWNQIISNLMCLGVYLSHLLRL